MGRFGINVLLGSIPIQQFNIMKPGPAPSLTCEFCGKRWCDFKTKESYREHYKKHLGIENTCSHCNKVFQTVTTLREHVKRIHCKKVACDCCDKSFSNINNLKRHKKQQLRKKEGKKERQRKLEKNKKIKRQNKYSGK